MHIKQNHIVNFLIFETKLLMLNNLKNLCIAYVNLKLQIVNTVNMCNELSNDFKLIYFSVFTVEHFFKHFFTEELNLKYCMLGWKILLRNGWIRHLLCLKCFSNKELRVLCIVRQRENWNAQEVCTSITVVCVILMMRHSTRILQKNSGKSVKP